MYVRHATSSCGGGGAVRSFFLLFRFGKAKDTFTFETHELQGSSLLQYDFYVLPNRASFFSGSFSSSDGPSGLTLISML